MYNNRKISRLKRAPFEFSPQTGRGEERAVHFFLVSIRFAGGANHQAGLSPPGALLAGLTQRRRQGSGGKRPIAYTVDLTRCPLIPPLVLKENDSSLPQNQRAICCSELGLGTAGLPDNTNNKHTLTHSHTRTLPRKPTPAPLSLLWPDLESGVSRHGDTDRRKARLASHATPSG